MTRPILSRSTPGADTMTLRVVGDGENGTLILAGETEVYALPLEGVTLYLDGGSVSASEIESGMSAEVWYTGGVQETYPAKFSQVVAVSLSREENAQYDLCGLYLQVLEDLWNTDDGLNGRRGDRERRSEQGTRRADRGRKGGGRLCVRTEARRTGLDDDIR